MARLFKSLERRRFVLALSLQPAPARMWQSLTYILAREAALQDLAHVLLNSSEFSSTE